MATIQPFQGVRYNSAKVKDLGRVVTPPYDVITPKDEERYRSIHQNNIVRLILPREEDTEDKYQTALKYLQKWLDEEVLIRESRPCFYALQQEYEIDGQMKKRLGITCLMKLEDYGKGTVLPHENTMSKPKEDRLQIMRTTKTNLDSVFGLYTDGEIQQILEEVCSGEPIASLTTEIGIKNSLWCITDPELVERIKEGLASQAVVIADGHHRYGAALAYRDEARAKAATSDSNAPHEYIMMTLVSLKDPGLVVLPTHRMIKNLQVFDENLLLDRLGEKFNIQASTMEKIADDMKSLREHAFGLYLGEGKAYTLKLKQGTKPEDEIEISGSDALKRLDVTVLHELILDRILGIGTQQLIDQSNVTYTRKDEEAMALIDSGEYQMVFLMNAPKVEEVREVAAAGDKMPQKSTYFYPKLPTGLVIRLIE